MDKAFKQVDCDPECGFMIRSHDEKELTEFVKQHAKMSHNMTITDDDVKSKMKQVVL
jgi:predicted small metal-binding protein